MNYKPTILYVEDEEGIRENVKRPLRYFSSELFIACDGQEGLELYKKYNPDIVVTDIKMPRMDGIEMSKAIKEIKPKQYIIIITAHNESRFLMEAVEMHIDSYILKPIDLDLLEKKIEIITENINIKRDLKIQRSLTQEISQPQDNFLIVLDKDEKIIFSNDRFLEFCSVANLDKFKKKHKCINYLLIKGNDYFYPDNSDKNSWLEQLKRIDSSNRLVSLLDKNNKPQIFIVFPTYIKNTEHTIITLTEVTTMELEKIEFEKQAYTDLLTNINNRTYFEKEFKKEIAKYEIENIPLSFIILDIDKFKNINDTYGHQAGDDILQELAQFVNSKTRKSDTFARWGGEEFVLILLDTNITDAKNIANNLRSIIEQHQFKNNLNITCSFGVAQFDKNDTQKSIMKRADDALYKAKENGRNRVEIEASFIDY